MVADASIDLSIIVPAHNEVDNLEPLVERVHRTLSDLNLHWELILVDDGSTDGSSQRMDQMAEEEGRLTALHFEQRHGQSAALEAGFIHSRGKILGLIDADLQTFPEDFPMLLEELERAEVDAVIGIRTERKDNWWKRLSSKIANGVRNRLTRENIIDTGCPLKVFRREAILGVTMFNGMHRFIPTLLKLEGYSVIQIPVRHTRRRMGVTKYGIWDRALRGIHDALAVRWMQDRRTRWKIR
ncbi:MAG: glycosyltransferase family 2 protein [Thermoanaerobaculales bacterium]|nr:glycosyltransferase family 2 protein [Thermoanaerobaculales bacterium]